MGTSVTSPSFVVVIVGLEGVGKSVIGGDDDNDDDDDNAAVRVMVGGEGEEGNPLPLPLLSKTDDGSSFVDAA